MSALTSWFASPPPPEAAIEVGAGHVSIAVVGTRGQGLAVHNYAVAPLPAGVVVPSLMAANILNRTLVIGALRTAVERAGVRPRRVALVIPDSAAKVSLVRFERVPSKREDLDQLVRWQLKKASPFPIEDASVTFTPAMRAADGSTEFLVVAARRDIVAEYEALCDELKMYAGLVDLATLSVVNLFLASDDVPSGDWLIVHLRPEYTSIVILRAGEVIFFRNRPEGDETSIADLVHQTAMYYQDRLAGQGFSRVLLGGSGRVSGAVEMTRQNLEARLGAAVEPIDPTRIATLADRISVGAELKDILAPLVGMLLRTRARAMAV